MVYLNELLYAVSIDLKENIFSNPSFTKLICCYFSNLLSLSVLYKTANKAILIYD
jgi:hypothetical protein